MKVYIKGTSVELIPENHTEEAELKELARDVADAYDSNSVTKNIYTPQAKFDIRSHGGVEIFLD